MDNPVPTFYDGPEESIKTILFDYNKAPRLSGIT